MEWQPIETAPKDGTIVRLYIPGHPRLEGMTGCWCNFTKEWIANPMRMSFGTEQYVPDPTMWMPR